MSEAEKITSSNFKNGASIHGCPLNPPPGAYNTRDDDVAITATEQTQPVVPSAPPASVIDHQPHQLTPYPPQPLSNTVATTTIVVTTATATTDDNNATTITSTEEETHTGQRTCCEDVYCPGFIFCYYIPTPCPGPGAGIPGDGGCNCDCLPATTACCEGAGIPGGSGCNCDCLQATTACCEGAGIPGGGGCNCDCLPATTACCEGGCNIESVVASLFSCNCGGFDSPIGLIILLVALALVFLAVIGLIALLVYQMGDNKPPAIARRYRISAVVFGFVGYAILIAVGIALAIVLI